MKPSDIQYILTLLLFTTLNFTYSQNKVVNDLSGYVRDSKSGEALVYANVMVAGSNSGSTTNLSGFFVIVDQPAELCTLVATYIGYKTDTLVVDNSKKQIIEINLTPTSIVTRDVNVVAEKYKVWKKGEVFSQVTISPKQLAKLPNLGEVDIFRSLQLLPGISGINDGSSGLYVRGGTPDQNLVLLDGMTVYHVDHFFGFFSAFNSDAIKDVQVYKGGFPAKFGGRMSSVVELTGKTGNINNFGMSLGANLLSANAVMEIPVFEKGSLLISGRRSYADLISSSTYESVYNFLTGDDGTDQQQNLPARFNQVEEEVLPEFYFYDLNAKLSYQISKIDFLSISFYNGEDYLDESEDGQQQGRTLFGTDISGVRINDDVTNWGNIGGSINWSRQWSDRFYSKALLATTSYFNERNRKRGFDFGDDSDSLSNSFSFRSLEDNTVDDLTFRFDSEYMIDSKNDLHFGIWFSDVSTNFIFEANDTLKILDRTSEAQQLSMYTQNTYKPFNSLQITGGLRSTYLNSTSKYYLEPRLSLKYKLGSNVTVSGSWGIYHQFVNHITNEDVLEGTRDFWLVADESLEPGKSTHYILGMEYENDDYLFSVDGYYKKMENLIEFTQRVSNSPRAGTNQNFENNFFVGDGIAKGIEFLSQKKFGDLNGWVTYTLGEIDYTFPDLNSGNTFPASHDRTHEVKIIGAYSVGKWSFSAAWIFATGKAYTAPESQYFIELLDGERVSYFHVSDKNSNRLPDYHRLDLSATYQFKNKSLRGDLGLSIFNLYNHKNVWYKEYDLDVSPIVITDVSMLGLTPTVFFKLYF